MFPRRSSVCSLQPHNLRKNRLAPGEPRTRPLCGCRDLDPLPTGEGRGAIGSWEGMKISLRILEHQTRLSKQALLDAPHSWALTRVYPQSCHSPSRCFAARFLYSLLISQGSSFGLIIPTGINRTAAAVLASAASFAEQQCGLLEKAGAGSQEH